MSEEKVTKKERVPTALKRHKQDLKKNLLNRMWKSRVLTARNAFAAETDAEKKKALQNALNSILDKAAKIGLFKKNKVSRLKSRAASKLA